MPTLERSGSFQRGLKKTGGGGGKIVMLRGLGSFDSSNASARTEEKELGGAKRGAFQLL